MASTKAHPQAFVWKIGGEVPEVSPCSDLRAAERGDPLPHCHTHTYERDGAGPVLTRGRVCVPDLCEGEHARLRSTPDCCG